MSRADALSTTCTISRNPSVGETAVTQIATGLPCMPVYPAGSGQQFAHSVQYDKLETIIQYVDGIQQEDVFECGDELYTIAHVNKWPLMDGNVLQVVLEVRK
jgi:hypothetical protein